MKAEEIKNKLGVSDEAIEKSMDFNALRIVMNEEFAKPEVTDKDGNDYRERSINRCVEARVPFTSDTNTIYNFVERFITVRHPINGNIMKSKGGGGNNKEMTINFRDDETGDEMSISFMDDSFHIKPKQ